MRAASRALRGPGQGQPAGRAAAGASAQAPGRPPALSPATAPAAVAHVSRAEPKLGAFLQTLEWSGLACLTRFFNHKMREVGAAGEPLAFRALFKSIIFQQISGKAGASILARVADACGG